MKKKADASMITAMWAEARRHCPRLSESLVIPVKGDRRLMVISESPSVEDEDEGRGYSCEQGRMVRRAIAGQDSFTPWLTFAIKYHCPATPTPEEIAAFRPSLLREVALVNPRRIICLGGSAAKCLSGDYDLRVGKYSGKIVNLVISGQRYPVHVTWHPNYVMQRGGIGSSIFYTFIEHLREAKQHL